MLHIVKDGKNDNIYSNILSVKIRTYLFIAPWGSFIVKYCIVLQFFSESRLLGRVYLVQITPIKRRSSETVGDHPYIYIYIYRGTRQIETEAVHERRHAYVGGSVRPNREPINHLR